MKKNVNPPISITPFVDDIIEIVVEWVKRSHLDIAILVMYGSRAKNTDHPRSDLEFFAVVDKQDQNKKFRLDFMFHGVPVDAWGQDWENVERIADVEGYWVLPAASIVLGKIVYSRSDKDLLRYTTLVEQISDPSPHIEKQHDNALASFNQLYGAVGQFHHAIHLDDKRGARDAGWNILIGLSILLAQLNNQFLTDNWGLNLKQVFGLPLVPNNLEELAEIIVTVDDFSQQEQAVHQLLENTRQLLITQNKPRTLMNVEYEMIESIDTIAYLNKIRKAHTLDNILAASYAVHDLQPLIARDLLKREGKMGKAISLLFNKEMGELYDKLKLPDFFDAITHKDWDQLIKLVDDMEKIVRWNFSDFYKKIPHFADIKQLRDHFNQI